MLTGSYRVNIRSEMTLNEIFNTFDSLGLLDENDVIHYNYRKNYRDSRNNTNRRDFKNERPTHNFRNNRNFKGQQNNPHNSSNSQNNYPQQQNNSHNFSGQYRNNYPTRQQNNTQNSSRQYRNNNSRPFNNGSGQVRPRQNTVPNNIPNSNNPVPMEVDNIQNSDVNFFQNQPRTENSQ